MYEYCLLLKTVAVNKMVMQHLLTGKLIGSIAVLCSSENCSSENSAASMVYWWSTACDNIQVVYCRYCHDVGVYCYFAKCFSFPML